MGPSVPALRIRRIFGGARTRILAAFVVLMAFSTVVSVIAIYEVLVVRADDRLDAALQQEVEEFRQLASGINPANGTPFEDDLEAIFRLYEQRNVLGRGETIVMFVDGRFFDDHSAGSAGAWICGTTPLGWRTAETERGEIETASGDRPVPGGPGAQRRADDRAGSSSSPRT